MNKILFFRILPSSNAFAHLMESPKVLKYTRLLNDELKKNNISYLAKYDEYIAGFDEIDADGYDFILYSSHSKLDVPEYIEKKCLFISSSEIYAKDVERAVGFIKNRSI